MFFHKKEKGVHASPIGAIRRMSAQGMSDRDIIKKLKSEGYSLDDIEKGMLEAVKQGVGTEEDFREPEPMEFSSREEGFEPVPRQQEPEPFFDTGFEPAQENVFEQEELTGEDMSPELMIEELVEGVVSEKWQKFDTRIKSLENQLHELLISVKRVQQAPATQNVQSVDDTKITEIQDQLEEMEARVGGLEKAFKQFLPSLTKNIENLSEIIKEMKEKHEDED